jgi:hypothetical protein
LRLRQSDFLSQSVEAFSERRARALRWSACLHVLSIRAVSRNRTKCLHV